MTQPLAAHASPPFVGCPPTYSHLQLAVFLLIIVAACALIDALWSSYPSPVMSRKQPLQQRYTQILTYLQQQGECRADDLGHVLNLAPETAAHYVRELERQQRVVTRLETFDEAKTRAQALPRSVFHRAKARRQLVYRLADPVAAVA